jgi:SAM-dependent methyltransferase
MAFEYHENRKLNFEYQIQNTENYILPFIEKKYPVRQGMEVLEIGCGEGGILKPFADKGCRCTGVDLHEYKITLANEYLKEYVAQGKISFIYKDIYDLAEEPEHSSKYDLIILKDTIEHIHGHEKIINLLKVFLKPGGHIYFGFPPWQMPFGGHQQVCSNKLLSVTPYFHLLPDFLYKGILKIFNEEDGTIEFLIDTKRTRITPEKFERIAEDEGYKIVNKKFYLISPMYQYKFNVKPKEQLNIISKFPYLRNFLTTTCDYLVRQ